MKKEQWEQMYGSILCPTPSYFARMLRGTLVKPKHIVKWENNGRITARTRSGNHHEGFWSMPDAEVAFGAVVDLLSEGLGG